MENGASFSIGVTVGLLLNFGYDAAFDYQPTKVYQKSAIEAGVGRYNEKTTKFEWIPPVKEEK